MSRQIVNYPAFQVAGHGSSKILTTAASTVIDIPRTANGAKPSFIRLAISVGAAHVFLASTATSATATTGDTLVVAGDGGAFINTLGLTSIGALASTTTGFSNPVLVVTPLEEGALNATLSAISG